MKKLFALLLLIGGAYFTWAWAEQQAQQIAQQPLQLTQADEIIAIEQGSNARQLLKQFVTQGWISDHGLLRYYFRFFPEQALLQAGHYRLHNGMSLRDALMRIVGGEIVQQEVRFIEGWTFRDVRRALAQAPLLQHKLSSLSDTEVMNALGVDVAHPEGQFFPASYRYTEKVSDLDVLKIAHQRLQDELQAVWSSRLQSLPYQTPYDALIMASLVEKETGYAPDRPQIAGVFVRRLDKRMRLQTDPAVIYGLGEKFDGNLRKIDLQTDSPYNTYTRAGLPPTPIALVGRDALKAAVQPAGGDSLYFVARGDGSSVFSSTLEQHNIAVRRYQLKRK
jgi:UPF0755 protein